MTLKKSGPYYGATLFKEAKLAGNQRRQAIDGVPKNRTAKRDRELVMDVKLFKAVAASSLMRRMCTCGTKMVNNGPI